MFYSCYHQTQLKTIQYPSSIISRVVIFFGFLFSGLPNFREHIFLVRASISALFSNIAHIYEVMKTSNYVVWPAPSPEFLKMALPGFALLPCFPRKGLCWFDSKDPTTHPHPRVRIGRTSWSNKTQRTPATHPKWRRDGLATSTRVIRANSDNTYRVLAGFLELSRFTRFPPSLLGFTEISQVRRTSYS